MPIDYTLVRSKKRKRSFSLKITSDGALQVNVPYKTKLADIESFIAEKHQWIVAKQKQNQRLVPPEYTYQSGEKHYYRGRTLPLHLIVCHFSSVRFTQDSIAIFHRKNSSIKNILVKAYKQEALQYLTQRTHELAQAFSLTTLKQVKVRQMKARWGSCSHDGIITYNSHLIKAADDLIDYVIIHELCHLVHHNHGRGFYRLQSALNPRWKTQKQSLHEQGYRLIY